ncbi:protein-methionine sulfoxide oxidase mical3b-like [Symsagittifera roscoffensis]|uniref:protein-methionine sulfoxide oxidase mical3b-like n=1 Tax=Symsagittifera roscoffensis TaxID=84072 RepID=UPI00307B26D3
MDDSVDHESTETGLEEDLPVTAELSNGLSETQNLDSSPSKLPLNETITEPLLGSPEEKLSGQNVFEELVNACTFKGTLKAFKRLCNTLNIDPNADHRQFYTKLSSLVLTWRAKHLWAKLSKRAGEPVYQKGNAAINSKVLVIGAGPCGLRTAVECAFLGAKVVLVEKRDAFTRNNVLHLWDVVIRDLTSLGAKKLYKKFCISSIDHISIRQLQLILLKIALLLGVEIHHSVSYEDVIMPESEDELWRARLTSADPETEKRLSEYTFDVLIGADGRRNSFADFKRYANRAKLAIAITANFKNGHTNEENCVPEIAGVTSYAKPDLFRKLAMQKINLENVVYYKDATHYFIMTAHKSSLLERGVLISDYAETDMLLAESNISQEDLLKFAHDAAAVATDNALPLNFAKNHYNQPDVAMFDFTSMYYADNAARVYKKHGKFLLKMMVGDSLIEPFWPTGSGIGKGFLSAFDAAWTVKNWSSGSCSVNQILSEHEASYKSLFTLLSSDRLKSLPARQFYPLDPAARYPSLSMPSLRDVNKLFITDDPEQSKDSQGDVLPQKQLDNTALLHWVQKTLLKCEKNYSDFVKIEDLTRSWQDTRAFAVLLHIFHPELINIHKLRALRPDETAELVFNKLPAVGIYPGISHSEFISEVPDELSVLSILVPLYHRFRDVTPASQLPKYNKIVDNSSEFAMPNNTRSGDERKSRQNNHRQHHYRNISVNPSPNSKNGDNSIPLFARESSVPKSAAKTKNPRQINKLDLSENKWIESLNDDTFKPSKSADKKSNRPRRALRSVGGSEDVGGEVSDNSSSPSNSPAKSSKTVQRKSGAEKVKCLYCKEDVLMLDRMLLEGQYFHRSCFRCIYCKKLLTEQTYSYFKSEEDKSNHFYCSTHYRWRTEGFIGPPSQAAEKLPGYKGSVSNVGEKKRSTGGGLASLLTDIPIQQAVKPVERIQIEVSKAHPASKRELTEEEMSDINYGPGYQTADNNSEASSDEASDFTSSNLLDSAVMSQDAMTNWREVYSARMFVSGVHPNKAAQDDKSKNAKGKDAMRSKRKQVESEDDADDEGDTEVERSDNEDEDSGTEIENTKSESEGSSSNDSSTNTAQEFSETEPMTKSLPISMQKSPVRKKSKPPRVKLPMSAARIQTEDSETEVEGDKIKNMIRRRARRPRPTKERITKVTSAVMRLKTEVQPEPMSLDVLLGGNNNKSPEKRMGQNLEDTSPDAPAPPQSSIVHRREVIKIRSNFLEAQNQPENSPERPTADSAMKTEKPVDAPENVEKSGDADSAKPNIISIEKKDLTRKTSTSSGTGASIATAAQEQIVKKTLDFIPQSSALSLMEQLDQTYKQYKREDKPAQPEPLKQVRIITPPPEEKFAYADKESPPVPAFDPRVNVENSVRKALGSKTREEERADRKAKLASLKAAHFGGGASGTEIVKRVPDSDLKVATNSTKPTAVSPTSPPPATAKPVVKPFKMTTYMSKEFTKVPGANTVNVENKFNSSIQVPIKATGLQISKDTGKIILQQNATESKKMTRAGEVLESNKSIENKSWIRPLSVNISPPPSNAIGGVTSPKAIESSNPVTSGSPSKKSKSPSGSQSTKSSSSSITFPSLFGSRSSSMTSDAKQINASRRPNSTVVTSKTSEKDPFVNSPDSESALSGPISPEVPGSQKPTTSGSDSQQVKHTKLNSTVKVTLLESRPQPILSYKVPEKKPQVCLTDIEVNDDPGVLSDTTQIKSPKSGSMKFFKKFKSSFSSEKASKLKQQKSTSALNDASIYSDDQGGKTKTLGAESRSPNLPTKKEKNFFAGHFRIKSATLKNEKLGSMPLKENNKSDSKLGLHAGSGNQRKSSQSFKDKEKVERRSEHVPVQASNISDDESTLTEKIEKPVESQPVSSVPNELENGLIKEAPLAEPEGKNEIDDSKPKKAPASPEKTETRPETPVRNNHENKAAAEMLKSNRKARQTKQKEKIKQMQLKLGLKYLPGTLDTKIDSITDFCGGRRTSGVNKDLDDLYNEVASSEKGLPYYKQTDLRRSMEKLTDGKLQSFEIVLENDVPSNENVNKKGVENGNRELDLVQMELIAKRMENLEHVSRCQNLERVTREIEEKEILLKAISERGALIEKSVTDKKVKKKDRQELTQKWVEIKQELDSKTAEISELVYMREQLILDVRHYNLKQEIRELMNVKETEKSEAQIEREKQLLQEIIEVVDEKNQLVQKLESERLLDEQLHSDTGANSTTSANVDGSNPSLKPKRKIKTMFKK